MNRDFFISKIENIGSLVLFLKNKKNIEYLSYLNSQILPDVIDRSIQEKIWYYINDAKTIQNCICGNHLAFINFKAGYRKSCGNKSCSIYHRKETSMIKYGVDNPKKSKEVIQREKDNILSKYNGKHYMLDDKIKEKFNTTMLDRYGVEWAQQNLEIKNKSLDTFKNNPNREDIISKRSENIKMKSRKEKNEINIKRSQTIEERYGSIENYNLYKKEKIREVSLLKYDTEHFLKSDLVINKRRESYYNTITEKIKKLIPDNITYINRVLNDNETDSYINLFCKDCDNKFTMTRQLFYKRCNSKANICLVCNPIVNGSSNIEDEIYNFISEIYNGDIIRRYTIDKKEIDIYIPNLKLGFEVNGLYWHSELYKKKSYHIDKTNTCLLNNIDLFHIWEDDWLYKVDIIKSMILNKLNKSVKIYARKCEVVEISDSKIVSEFLLSNHIQGRIGSKIKLGLLYNGELVSLMTFGNLRISLGQKSKKGNYELLRFCNKLNTSVIGGASKLFSHFIKNFDFDKIISYCDISRSNGNLYNKLGFNMISKSTPNYYWIINGLKINRFNYRKDKLVSQGYDTNKTEVSIMHDLGHYRIFDCGSQKWEFLKNQ